LKGNKMDLQTARTALDAFISANIPVFLWGAPGVGKSDTVRTLADQMKLPLFDVRATLLDPVDLRGVPHVANGKTQWAAPGFLPDENRDGPAGILFLDELNAAPPSVQVACYQLVLDRRVGEYDLPDGWRIIAAGNRQSDRAAAQRMPTALANRFAHIDIEPDLDAWCAWAAKTDLNPLVAAFIRFRPELLHDMRGADLRAFPTPRAWAQVSRIANVPEGVRFALVAGLVGEAAAAEFEGFVRIWQSLPPINTVLADPQGAPVPSDPATLYAITAALSRKVDRSTFGAALVYASRIPREFAIVLAVDAVKRAPELCETAAFVAWANANQDITL
jgi:MoxR-like ATPase